MSYPFGALDESLPLHMRRSLSYAAWLNALAADWGSWVMWFEDRP